MVSRSEFLSNQWSPYPSLPDRPNSLEFGRIYEISSEKIKLFRQNGVDEFDFVLKTEEHPVLGLSIPPSLLVRGDVIAFDKQTRLCFLLSPCLQGNSKLFDQEVRLWNDFLDQVTHFFRKRDFLHTPTPTLVESPGVDHHIHFLSAVGVNTGRSWYLPTSPEIHLKKLLCQGYERIFEIKKVFRDDLIGPHHRVEFTMLEWYRAFEDLRSIENDLKELLSGVSPEKLDFKSLTVSQAFEKYVGFRLEANTTLEELIAICTQHGIHYLDNDSWNDLFFRIFIEKIEKNLGNKGPLFLWHFPAQQSSLSQINRDGWCERFELYWKGVELANAYLEVNDPDKNKALFLSQQELRKSSGFEVSQLDLDFFKQTRAGMPPASGVALGLDRLKMVLNRRTNLEGL